MPATVRTSAMSPLEGMAFAVYLRAAGHEAHFDTEARQVVASALSGPAISAEYLLFEQQGDPRTYLREHLRAAGLLAAS